jgi:hypothetical protein
MPTPSMQRARQADSTAGDPDSAIIIARLVSRWAKVATFRLYIRIGHRTEVAASRAMIALAITASGA